MSTGPFKILQKAFLERTVEHLKPRPAHALPLAASLHDAVRAFEMAHAGSVVILNDELELKGIFTERDLLFKFQPGKELTKIPITSMMSAPVVSIGARASVARVLHLISLG
ncbi:MAG: CBS domain-containing protein, partial [Oligoflexia bacterium]|nr:CBS domain-containing protein [Oligoflexia bacterium]